MSKHSTEKLQQAKGLLGWIEKVGNKLPHPFWLFVWICILIIFTSALTSFLNVSVTDPQGQTVAAQNLLSGAGLRWFLENMVTNFAHFAPVGLVLVGAIVVRRYTIPRAARFSGMEKVTEVTQKSADLSPEEKKGLRHAGIAFLVFALAGYIVLMLVVAQFIYMFTWSNLDTILAVEGALFLKTNGLTGPMLLFLFIVLIAILNIFMGSGSAKWAIFALVFIPMLAQFDYSPAFVQLMYRVGDSVTNSISPLYIYFPLLLGWIRQYDKRIGIGTTISMLIPYAAFLFVMWTILLFVWFALNLPIGVGEFIYMK